MEIYSKLLHEFQIDRAKMAAESVEVIQSMIDISADRLERLRTQCATSAELTQQETRTLESKLIRMFSELLLTKQKLPPDHLALPQTNYDLKQWLRVVGELFRDNHDFLCES